MGPGNHKKALRQMARGPFNLDPRFSKAYRQHIADSLVKFFRWVNK